MPYTLLVLLACLAGHPDRCETYRLDTDARPADCRVAVRQWIDERPYLRAVAFYCREEVDA